MNKALGLVVGVLMTAVVTVGTLFLIRQSKVLARLGGLTPASTLNPVAEIRDAA